MTVHGVVVLLIDYDNATDGPKFPKQISREKESLNPKRPGLFGQLDTRGGADSALFEKT